jgi:hypothetical protein
MPFAPAVSPRADQYIYSGLTSAGNAISSSLAETLQKLDQTRRENAFGDTVIQKMAQVQSPNGQPYVPADLLLKYEQGNRSTRMGIVQGALANAHFDAEQQTAQAIARWHTAQANRFDAQANNLWSGGTDDTQPFTPTPDQIQQGRDVGQIWLPTGPNQGRWVEDPNSPINMGGDINMNNIASRDLGGGNVVLYDKGSGKLLPPNRILRPNLVQAAGQQNALGSPISTGGGLPPAQPATQTLTSPPANPSGVNTAPPGKMRVRGPDGNTYFIPAEQLQQALARGLTVVP